MTAQEARQYTKDSELSSVFLEIRRHAGSGKSQLNTVLSKHVHNYLVEIGYKIKKDPKQPGFSIVNW